jgi:hypothetical protein
MPRVSDVFGSQYLRAADLTAPLVATIEGWSSETIFKELTYFLTFRGQAFKVKLTTTNANDLARLFGEDFDRWVDHEIELYPVSLEITDRDTGLPKTIEMIRIRAPSRPATGNSGNQQPKTTAPAVPAKSAARDDDLDDSIPF